MEINILNFGPIKKCEIDLSKDLIVIYGKNNIGKSYAMSVVYLLLKHLLSSDFIMKIKGITQNKTLHKKSEAIAKIIQEEKKRDITDDLNKIITYILNRTLFQDLESSFQNTFGELDRVKNCRTGRKPLIRLNVSGYSIELLIGKTIQVKNFSSDKSVTGETIIDIEFNIEREIKYYLLASWDAPLLIKKLLSFIFEMILEFFKPIENEFRDIYFLPASRTGLYTGLISFFPILTALSKKRSIIDKKIELPTMSEPIADYILQLSEIQGRTTKQKPLHDIARSIEIEILKGAVIFDTEKNHLNYSPVDSGLVLDMNSVSSMVSELAPVVAFIKYILEPINGNSKGKRGKEKQRLKPVIFIEEPEAHLHPEAQVKLAEIFVMLIEAGVKLIISSHSSYIFNKLSNMAIEKTLDLDKYAPVIFTDSPKGSVSKLMNADDLGVEDENFIDTAAALYEEREAILEKLNRSTDD